MKYYLDITLLPSADIPIYFLWEKLYQQFHLALVEVKDANERVNIGVSFPQYKSRYLGGKLRVFAKNETDLELLSLHKWLSRLLDYVHMTSIRPVPNSIDGYVSFYRLHKRKSNIEKAKSNAQRKGVSLEEAFKKLEGRSEEQPEAPFIRMNSLSSEASSAESKNRFCLVIGKKEQNIEKLDNKNRFNTYGLSKISAVPWFA